MHVFARRTLVPAELKGQAAATDRLLLLLEGSWSEPASATTAAQTPAGERLALDDLIASPEFTSLDIDAQRLVEQITQAAAEKNDGLTNVGTPNFADLNALKLRYAAVKWLRVIALRRLRPELFAPTTAITLHLGGRQDAEYPALWQALASVAGFRLTIAGTAADGEHATATAPAKAPTSPGWKRWLARAFADRSDRRSVRSSTQPRVLLVGNPRLLDGVCDELLRRGVQVAWLYDQLPARAWLKRRGQGIAWLTCGDPSLDTANIPPQLLGNASSTVDVKHDGVRLNDVVEAWYHLWAPQQAGKQARQRSCVARHFASRRITHVLLDEDATPLARAVISHAAATGVSSWVAQHGVCGVRFGFVPLKADGLFAWDEGSLRQMTAWGEAAEKVVVTGSPYHDDFLRQITAARTSVTQTQITQAGAARKRRILLAAVPSPRDERPDAVEFHLTTDTYARMLQIVCDAAAEHDDVELVVKLHPRATGCDRHLTAALQRHAKLRHTIIQKPSLAEALVEVDCVVSCASSAGVDAALAGIPVVQVLPQGSGEVIPASWYGLLGSARTLEELRPLLAEALSQPPTAARPRTALSAGSSAAARIVDRLLASSSSRKLGDAATDAR
ncbi:MAG: hypothetical protein QM775_14130 [Pirellulales bacterium]